MFVRYGLAAVLAALATLMGNVVWAQDSTSGLAPADCCQKAKCCAAKACCAAGACCKDGKCCKDGECCCKSKKCDASCTCCKDNKCACGKGSECSCGKSGKCGCKEKSTCCGKSGECCCTGKSACGCKGKASHKKTVHGSCPFLNKLAKNTAIIMVMPSSLPLLGACHPEVMGLLPHPPLPMGPQVMLPAPLPPPPPMLTPPGLPVPAMTSPLMPPQHVALPNPVAAPPQGYPCPQPVILPAPCAANPPVQASTTVDTCLSLLDLASEVCSLMHPNRPSLCASALELLMMGMCPRLTVETRPAMPHGMYTPQAVPPAPSVPQPCDLAYPITPPQPPNQTVGPCPTAATPPAVVPCAIATPTNAAKVRVIATSSGDKLEMNVGDATCIRCKKMTVKIGEKEITLSCFDDRVRVRGEELKATADCVRSDRKDHLILEGDVVLRYKKDGHSANVTGDRIELNLSSGAVTIKPAAKTTVRPAVRLDVIDAVGP